MATGSEIAEQVLDTVQDTSFDEDTVLAKLNECAGALSRKFVLPSLDAEADVITVTSAATISLPVTYQRNLYHCRDAAGRPIDVANSKSQLFIDHEPGKPGVKVRAVAAVGRLLVYVPTPAVAETLTINFQRRPTAITAGAQIDLLPDGFDDIFVNYALWKLYEKLEQGMDGAKVDTNHYMGIYFGLRDELAIALKEGVSLPPPPIARIERW